MKNTTIAAVSTPMGSGGIGIIRISGPESVNIAEQMFVSYSRKKVSSLPGYSGILGEVVYKDATYDQAILYRYKAPKSYTGEEVVEISCHGGTWITQQVLRITYELGAVPAEAGEFTKRAFLNGKIDLLEAEAVMDIINVQSNASLKAANEIRRGKLSTDIDDIVENVLNQSAHLAAWSDYPDEDMEMIDVSVLSSTVDNTILSLTKLIDTYDYGQIIKGGIVTAIVGRPNVGKSTLMNILSGYETSIVSNMPGTTRDVVKESIRLGDLYLQIADTAGIRDTEDVVEKVGVERAKKQIDGAQLILALFDNSQKLSDDDNMLIEMIREKNTIAIVNKADLENQIDIEYLKTAFKHLLVISAQKFDGIEMLQEEVEQVLDLGKYNQGDFTIIANERQRQSLLEAKKALEEARDAISMGMTLDAVAVCLEETLDALMSLTGQRVQDEVVTKVFANFCVGK